MWASASGTLDTVLILLDYKADVNAQANVSNRMMMMMMMMMMMIVIYDEVRYDCSSVGNDLRSLYRCCHEQF